MVFKGLALPTVATFGALSPLPGELLLRSLPLFHSLAQLLWLSPSLEIISLAYKVLRDLGSLQHRETQPTTVTEPAPLSRSGGLRIGGSPD